MWCCCEGEVVSIDLCEFSCEIVYSVVNFCYSGELDLCIDNVGPVLKCADELGICIVVHICLDFLSNICVETAIIVYSIAENYGIEELRCAAMKFICCHFSEVRIA